jgi:protein-S-isoprenylcysteine O-methyltransferase Ste14
MALKDELERSGEMLFRWRSYPPILFFGVVLWGMRDSAHAGAGTALNGAWEVVCIIPVLAGLAVRMWAIGTAAPNTSGGNRSGQIAEELNTTGAYSLVRHPLYLGVLLVWTGVAMFPRSFVVVLVVWLLFWVYYERIMIAEESFLERKFGPPYSDWANRTPVILPRLTGYVKPRYPHSMRMALRREYSAWLAAATPLFVLKLYGDYIRTGHFVIDRVWLAGFILVVILATGVRALKHYTRILKTR